MKVLIIFITIFFNFCALSQLPEPLSTRLLSTSGAGVGAILLNESTILNPASAIFFNTSSFYYQKDDFTLNDDGDETSLLDNSHQEIYSIIDDSTSAKGGFSYIHQYFNGERRKRYSLSLSRPLGKKSSIGLIYKFTDAHLDNEYLKLHQFLIGFTHVQSNQLSFGLTINDPQFRVEEDFKVTAGIQYTFSEMISFLYDIGTGDMQNPDKKSFNLWAIQVGVFKDFFIRYGGGTSNFEGARYQSWGVSWTGPRLSLEYAYRNSDHKDTDYAFLQDNESLDQHSFALTILF